MVTGRPDVAGPYLVAHVKRLAGTDLCEAPHFQYHVRACCTWSWPTGRSSTPGPATSALRQGHDARVVGDEPVVVIDW